MFEAHLGNVFVLFVKYVPVIYTCVCIYDFFLLFKRTYTMFESHL